MPQRRQSNLFYRARTCLILVVAVCFFAGCKKKAQQKFFEPVILKDSLLPLFIDVVLPLDVMDFKVLHQECGDGSAMAISCHTRLSNDALVLFYKKNMKVLGWKSGYLFFDDQTLVLSFDRPTRRCIVLRTGILSLLIIVEKKSSSAEKSEWFF